MHSLSNSVVGQKVNFENDHEQAPKGFENAQNLLREKIHSCVISTVQKIAEDYEKRLQGYENNVECLNGGIWMPNAYFKALDEKKKITRLKYMVSKNYFDHFYSKDFEAIPSADAIHKTGFVKYQIRIKKGVSPSEALKSAQRGPTLVDCATVCQIGQYQALLEVLGEEKFNYLFGHETGSPLVLCSYAIDNPLMPFLRQYTIKNSEKWPINEVNLEKGWRVVFNNVSKYNIKHGMRGDAVSFNVICFDTTVDKEKFIGFGLGGKEVTEEQIEQALINEYNAQPITEKLSADHEGNNCNSEDIITLESAKKDPHFGFDSNLRLDLNIDLIQELSTISKEDFTIEKIKAIIQRFNS
ncbi:hypothetical protein [Candidatus Protochlamydia amoebophila]|uniref:Uncharacterized protein n=1 Tax=Protochlamydia amoebophila (strain UWE25) TaxID=264201 RepID=Q6MBU4_PARUW|nr:hypothetical protein [Candidatus Protochlamydia amoebophila]CAF23955.1 unnamed protein product [Candidatus Protochlamydia amoebophila UWE25]